MLSRNAMVIMVKLVLKKLSLSDLKQLQRLMNAGQMIGVFEEALDKAVESKIADEWQQENQMEV